MTHASVLYDLLILLQRENLYHNFDIGNLLSEGMEYWEVGFYCGFQGECFHLWSDHIFGRKCPLFESSDCVSRDWIYGRCYCCVC